MLITPLGKIRVCADCICIDYKAIKHNFNRPLCKDKPVSGCYRIEIDAKRRRTISCMIELDDPDVCNTGDSGQDYLNAEFIKHNIILTIGMKDDDPAFESVRIEYGLQYNLLQSVDKVVFGVAWATDYEGTYDCRTWYAADPTILI